MAKVTDFIYRGSVENHIMRIKTELDPSRCSFNVAEYGRITDWHQCNAKPVEKIDGYGFCVRHARKVNQELGRLKPNMIRYAASFTNGEPVLIELMVESETKETIFITSVKNLIGRDYAIGAGLVRKNSQYTISYKFFGNKNEAIGYLIGKADDHVRELYRATERAEETHKKLLEAWYS